MNQRDRQWATIIIWGVFLFSILMVYERVLMIPGDFSGLWPDQTPIYPLAQDAEYLRQVLADARANAPALMAEVQNDIVGQLAQRVPIVAALTVLLMAAATICTWFVWRNAGLEAYLAREAVQAEKAKRRTRIEQFMEDLDSDEMDQLRLRLTDDSAKAER